MNSTFQLFQHSNRTWINQFLSRYFCFSSKTRKSLGFIEKSGAGSVHCAPEKGRAPTEERWPRQPKDTAGGGGACWCGVAGFQKMRRASAFSIFIIQISKPNFSDIHFFTFPVQSEYFQRCSSTLCKKKKRRCQFFIIWFFQVFHLKFLFCSLGGLKGNGDGSDKARNSAVTSAVRRWPQPCGLVEMTRALLLSLSIGQSEIVNIQRKHKIFK